jgi:transposase-like protein
MKAKFRIFSCRAGAMRKLMKKLLKKQGFAPSRAVTDKLRSYPPAFRALGLTAEHVHSHRANNRAENAHQPIRRREA